MIPTLVFVILCAGGIAFLVHVFFALSRETRPRNARRSLIKMSAPVVIPLPPDPIFTASAIRPAGVPENTPFAIVTNSTSTAAAFYVDNTADEPLSNVDWGLFVNPQKTRLRRAR